MFRLNRPVPYVVLAALYLASCGGGNREVLRVHDARRVNTELEIAFHPPGEEHTSGDDIGDPFFEYALRVVGGEGHISKLEQELTPGTCADVNMGTFDKMSVRRYGPGSSILPETSVAGVRYSADCALHK